jgi:uncharacterized membrane protein (UPF0127 family)
MKEKVNTSKITLRLRDKVFLVICTVGLFFILVSKLYQWINPQPEPVLNAMEITIRQASYVVELPVTPKQMTKGLSNRESLEKKKGMMFVHNYPGIYSYTMKDMKFNLDFLFVKDKKIVDIAENVPFDFQGVIAGALEYDKVIELPGGSVNEEELQIGDEIFIPE